MTFEMLMEERFEAGMEKGIAKGRAEGITQGIEKGREEGITQGIEQGAYNTKLETAKTALSMNLPPEDISKLTGLPLETVLNLKDKS
jgi:predicted transposase/invertase (TIGR01784 family)